MPYTTTPMDTALTFIILLFGGALLVLQIIAWIRIFQKAGQAGWRVLVPIHNLWILSKITESERLFGIFLLLPIIFSFIDANLSSAFRSILNGLGLGTLASYRLASMLTNLSFTAIEFFIIWLWMHRLAQRFGKGTGFSLGLTFLNPVFASILGFGNAQIDTDDRAAVTIDHEQGETMYRRGDFTGAVDFFTAAVESDPNDWEAQLRVCEIIAEAYQDKQRLAEERNKLLKMEAVPEEVWIKHSLELGKEWEELGFNDRAINAYKGLLWKYHEGYDVELVQRRLTELGG